MELIVRHCAFGIKQVQVFSNRVDEMGQVQNVLLLLPLFEIPRYFRHSKRIQSLFVEDQVLDFQSRRMLAHKLHLQVLAYFSRELMLFEALKNQVVIVLGLQSVRDEEVLLPFRDAFDAVRIVYFMGFDKVLLS